MEKIENAIIIHGPGRSGTTLLSSILSLHGDLGWISGYVNKYPESTQLALLNKVQDISGFEKWNRGKRRFPRPSEAYNFWLHYIPEFNDNEIEVISEDSAERTIKAINSVLKSTGKKRFISKITGKSRYQTIDAVFKDPCVIWIDRNPKSVITSYYKLKWNYKHRMEKFNATPKLELLRQYAEQYKSFEDDKKELLKYNLKSFKYENLIQDRTSFFKEICEFANLPYNKDFENLVNNWSIRKDTNQGYKEILTEEEEAYLDTLI